MYIAHNDESSPVFPPANGDVIRRSENALRAVLRSNHWAALRKNTRSIEGDREPVWKECLRIIDIMQVIRINLSVKKTACTRQDLPLNIDWLSACVTGGVLLLIGLK